MSHVLTAPGSLGVIASLLFVLSLSISGCSQKEPATATADGTDLWILNLVQEGETLRAVMPRNLTDRPGYDNQPYFLPTGELLYVRMEGEKTDLWHWSTTSESLARFTTTPEESEFSPTPIPQSDGGISYIRSRTNTSGRLWRMPQAGADAEIVFPDIGPVGYHAWLDADHVALWLLQEPSQLQQVKLSTGEMQLIATGVGRSPQSVPQRRAVSYTRQIKEGTVLEIYDLDAASSKTLALLPQGGEFHAWTPDGRLLSTAGSKVFLWSEGAWMPVVDLATLALNLSRLAVSPDGKRLALVAERS